MRFGDLIRLESGQEGYVEDITRRTARVRMLPNNMAVIRASKLARASFLLEKRMALLVPVSVTL